MMRNPLRKTTAPRKIELNDLAAAFWLDKPPGKTPSKTVSNKGNSSERSWENPETKEFWQQCVTPYRNVISPPIFETIESLLSEIDNLPECPSVFKDDEQTPQKYLELSGVSLLAHTLNVCREIVELLKTRENDFGPHVGKALIAALGHDIGKHPTAHIPHILHSFKSALWLQQRIGHLEGREQIIAAIRLHHSDNNKEKVLKENPILAALVKADLHARQKELEALKNQNKTENTTMVDGSLSLNGFDPSLPDTDPKNVKVWFTKENFLSGLKSRITAVGFDAFCFNNQIYFSPPVIQQVLNRLRAENGFTSLSSPAQIREILSKAIPQVRNQKYRLSFKNNLKPLSRWFFVFDASMFESTGKINEDTPRDLEGRWLKSLGPI